MQKSALNRISRCVLALAGSISAPYIRRDAVRCRPRCNKIGAWMPQRVQAAG